MDCLGDRQTDKQAAVSGRDRENCDHIKLVLSRTRCSFWLARTVFSASPMCA